MADCTPHTAPEPAFEQPWHAQVFALTVHLNETGRFTWGQWVERFAATLARHGLSKELNGGEDYFAAWLETLEAILAQEGIAAPQEVEATRNGWEKAYLDTPHGAPVRLAEG
ncbi:nitrile hydratase accessory protein [Phaeobacter sp. QD34_3]|uniref:nitrile hydratase accessory protein n=1 Tax=unclassified Phaeobacter TaxID=2621772 RepID=UPI00237F29BA|nr:MULTISPECIES: nitrile hydratase accessory protein [unclassified Phaeobacter]MDE4131833.1 nitrile hydratase accessory protein [Phaeobacter sp. QD34_3]MDE4135471.1 nitrile hydratase accessory protein [Phaeobacter sp. QD34_24]